MNHVSEQVRSNVDMHALRLMLKSQYHASLAMLREAIEKCPEDIWYASEHKNAFWQIAYHALYYAHLYLLRDEVSFRPWHGHQAEVQHPDGIPGRVDPASNLPVIARPYTKAEALDYWRVCDEMVDSCVDTLDLHSPHSGFSWYRVPKLEHQFVNLRHIQHHAAQLADRLRFALDTGVRWVGARRED